MFRIALTAHNKRISGFGLRLRPNPRLSAWTSDTRQLLSEMLWDKI